MTNTSSTNSYQQPNLKSISLDPSTEKLPAWQSWWQKKSIRFKTTLVAIAIGTLPTVILSSTAYLVASRSITAKIIAVEKTLVGDLQNQVNVFMRDRYSDIQIMANLDIFTDPKLRDLVTAEEKSAALQKIQDASNIYNSIAVFDAKGDFIAKTDGKSSGNHLNRGYIQAAIEADAPVISSPRISTSSGIYSIYTAAPIKDKVTGKTIGFVRARMPVEVLKDLLQDYTTQGSQYYLLDGAGTIFLGSQGEYVIKTLSNESNVADKSYNYEAVDANQIFVNIESFLNNDEISVTTATNLNTQTEQFLAFAPPQNLAGLPDLDWQTIIAVDKTLLFASQRQLGQIFLLGTIAIALVVGSIARGLAKRALRPILNAAEAVEAIGKGNLATRLDVRGEDELAQLGVNINLMTAQLEQFVLEQTQSAQQARILQDMTLELSAVSDAQAALDLAVAKVKEALQGDRVLYYRFDSEGTGVVVAESLEPQLLSTKEAASFNLGSIEQYIEQYQQGYPQAVENIYDANLTESHLRELETFAVKSCLIAPVLIQEQLDGLLIVHQCATLRHWLANEVELITQIAKQTGFTLSRLELFQQQQQAQMREKQAKEAIQSRALDLLKEVYDVSAGDLTIRARVTEDEIGTIADSYNSTIESLQRLVDRVKSAAAEVKTTTGENELAVQHLAQAAITQSEAMSQTLAQVEAMSKSIRDVYQNAAKAEEYVKQANETIIAGDVTMNQTVAEINAIQTTVTETAAKVKRLGDASQEISQVVSLIGKFAAQTHLLALKASIEAARAGEEGKGFAVIAGEVRSLATQSAEATAEIDNLVSKIQLETNEVINAMNTGTEQVETGTKLVEQTRQSLNQVTTVSNEISQLVASIALAAELQSRTSAVVSETIGNIAAIAQDNSQSASQVSSAIAQLSTVAEKLQAGIGKFKT